MATDPYDIPDEAQRVLNLIAPGESGGRYDVLYGGGSFGDFTRHPNVPIPIREGPHIGEVSTAAGKYQFLNGTWNRLSNQLGLSNFSPASQDAAAWLDAQQVYERHTGRDLLGDLRAGVSDSQIRSALASEWPSLTRGRGGLALGGSPALPSIGGRLSGSLVPRQPPIPNFPNPPAVRSAPEPRGQRITPLPAYHQLEDFSAPATHVPRPPRVHVGGSHKGPNLQDLVATAFATIRGLR